jgi:phosphate transport system substrate-binding protein
MIIKKLSVISMVLVLLSCSAKKGTDTSNSESKSTASGEVKIDGSSTVYPITEAIAEEYRTNHPDVKVTAGVSGTGGGFKKFGRGEIDINDASRLIKDVEAKECETNKIKYVALKVAFDGLAVIVNKENKWLNSITVEELKKIWEPAAQGKVKKWNQINSKWPDAEFHLYGPGVASGTYDYFTEAIVGKTGSSRGDYTASEDDNVLVQGIEGDKNSLGFFGLAYFEENQDKLKLVGVDNGKGPVLPNKETVMSNTYAPLSRPLFIYVNEAATKRSEVVDFVNFYLEKAPVLVKDVGYIQLPEKDYQDAVQQFKDFLAKK